MSDKATLAIVCSVIALVAIANLGRFFWGITVTIGTVVLPPWTGGIAFVILGLLAAWGFRALRNLFPRPPKDFSNL